MALQIDLETLKKLGLPDSLVKPIEDGGQPLWGVNHDRYLLYDLVACIVDDLNVGSGTVLSNTLVDNGNGTYTWTPIVGLSFLINTHASSNPINPIVGLTAINVQEALEQLYLAISGVTGIVHPAVTIDPGSNPALMVDLSTQVATLDLSEPGSLGFTSILDPSINDLLEWIIEMDNYMNDTIDVIGVGGANNLGLFTGGIITNNVSIKQALQELETALLSVAVASTSTYVDNGNGTYTLDNNSISSPSSVIIDTNSQSLPLTTPILFDLTGVNGGSLVTVNVQEALEQAQICCDSILRILAGVGGGGIVAGGNVDVTASQPFTTNTGLGILPAGGFNSIDGFTIIEQALSTKKTVNIEVGSNPALTINTVAPLVDKLNLDLTAIGSYNIGSNTILLIDDIQGVIDDVDNNLVNIMTNLIGVGAFDIDMGTYAGTTLTDNGSIKQALEELEFAYENIVHITSVITDYGNGIYDHDNGEGLITTIDTTASSNLLSPIAGMGASNVQDGIAELKTTTNTIQTALGSTVGNMGTFTGSTITDGASAKQALQQLETSFEATIAQDPVTLSPSTNLALQLSGQALRLDLTAATSYDNATSGLTADNVQGAIDEIAARRKHFTITEVGSGTAVTDKTGEQFIVIPSYLNGYRIDGYTWSVYSTDSGTFRIDVLQNGVAIPGSNITIGIGSQYDAAGFTPVTLSTGDRLNIAISSSTGSTPLGLTITLSLYK